MIDLKALQDCREHSAGLVAYYAGKVEEAAEHARQNALLIAAGCKPAHKIMDTKWDRGHAARHQGFVDALDAVIAHFGDAVAEAA